MCLVKMMKNHKGLNGQFVATNIKVKCQWGMHSEHPRKFERPRLFSVGNSEEFGVGYCMKFGRQNIHTSKNFLVNLLGDYCKEFVTELEGTLMRKKTMIVTMMSRISDPPNHTNFMLLRYLLILCVYWICAIIMEALKLNICAFYYLGVSKIK